MVAALEISELVTGPLEFRRLNASLPATLMDGFGTGAPPLAYGFLPYGLTCNLGIRKDLFEALGGFNPEFTRAYDLELCWRAQLGGHDLNFEPDAVVHRRMAPGLKGYWGRQIRDARMAPLLFRSFEAAGMRRSSTVRAVAEWIVLALRSVELALPKRRWRWIAQVSHRLGRLRGSIRYRVLYL
jgi:GT2 family glycosyltransferase